MGSPASAAPTQPPDGSTPEPVGTDRDRTADDRDRTSEAHDKASEERDERAEVRDQRAEAREDAAPRFDHEAAADRAGARRDRQGGASDRTHARDDREAASSDRSLSAHERAVYLVDDLTGAYRRDAGIMELEREISVAARTQQSFVLVFIDVDDLKATNDSLGHAAGDKLLAQVVDTIRRRVRSYDVIVRWGGDEFLCGLLDIGLEEAGERFAGVNADLAAQHAAVTSGLAELRPHEGLDLLIERADAALYKERALRAARTA